MPGDAETWPVSVPPAIIFCYARHRAVVVEARPSDFFLTETTTMIFIGILFCIAAIAFLCWLLFTLAVFALPFFAGVTAGIWAYDTTAGWLGAIIVGALAAGLTFGIGQLLLLFVRPLWARIAILLGFVAPAAIAGYHATHGIVKHVMPSEGWQLAFSVVGAIAVGATALMQLLATATPGSTGQDLARAEPYDAAEADRADFDFAPPSSSGMSANDSMTLASSGIRSTAVASSEKAQSHVAHKLGQHQAVAVRVLSTVLGNAVRTFAGPARRKINAGGRFCGFLAATTLSPGSPLMRLCQIDRSKTASSMG